MEIGIKLLEIFLICWIISRFEPIGWLLDLLPDKIIFNILRLLLTCLKCLVLWVTLVVTGSIFLASLICFLAFWYDKLIGPIELKVRL